MIQRHKSKYQVFNSGLADCYQTIDRKICELKQKDIHYSDASVGERRFWDAFVSGIQVEKVIRVPYYAKVEHGDLIVIDGRQYVIAQKDYKDDVKPESWVLSLQASPIEYRLKNG